MKRRVGGEVGRVVRRKLEERRVKEKELEEKCGEKE